MLAFVDINGSGFGRINEEPVDSQGGAPGTGTEPTNEPEPTSRNRFMPSPGTSIAISPQTYPTQQPTVKIPIRQVPTQLPVIPQSPIQTAPIIPSYPTDRPDLTLTPPASKPMISTPPPAPIMPVMPTRAFATSASSSTTKWLVIAAAVVVAGGVTTAIVISSRKRRPRRRAAAA